MKKLILSIAAIVGLAFIVNAQKMAFIDTEYIMDNIPAYKAAQNQLDQLSSQYQKELESIHADIEQMYKDFQAESVLLSEDMKRKREDVIITKEKDYKQLQKKYFGPNGDLFKKRQHAAHIHPAHILVDLYAFQRFYIENSVQQKKRRRMEMDHAIGKRRCLPLVLLLEVFYV